MLVGWLLPACCGTSPSISQRAAWKSSMKICACSSEVVTRWPFAGLFTLEQRHEDAERAEKPGGEIGDRDADAHRPLPGHAGDRHQPAHALRDLVEAGPVAIGPVLAEAGNAGVDEARIDRAQRLVVDAEPASSRRGGNSRRPRRPSSTRRLNTAMPSGSLRLSVMPRLLRCRFWKSGPWRGPPTRLAAMRRASRS